MVVCMIHSCTTLQTGTSSWLILQVRNIYMPGKVYKPRLKTRLDYNATWAHLAPHPAHPAPSLPPLPSFLNSYTPNGVRRSHQIKRGWGGPTSVPPRSHPHENGVDRSHLDPTSAPPTQKHGEAVPPRYHPAPPTQRRRWDGPTSVTLVSPPYIDLNYL